MSKPEPVILPYGETWPQIDESAFIAPTAVVIGETKVHANASVFYNCVLRGDINSIEVGAGSNIQDLSMLHVDDGYPCIVGCDVTVGHNAILHGCVVEDGSLIGMGAIVLTGAVIGAGSIVAAGALVPEGMRVPAGSLVAGVPAKLKKELPAEVSRSLATWAHKYQKVARAFITGTAYRTGFIADKSETG